MIISPSIASADLLHAAEEVRFICGHFPDLHVDIEDACIWTIFPLASDLPV